VGSEFDTLVGAVLDGDDLAILDRLSEKEKEIAWEMLVSMRANGDYAPIDNFWQLDYEVEPPTPEQFLTDDNYLGPVGRDLYPKWKETFYHIMDPRSDIHELILRGCLGSGKTFFGSTVMTYIICWLMHLKSPIATLLDTFSDTSSIFLAELSTDKDQLKKNMWTTTLRMLKLCPFIQSRAHLKAEGNYDDMLLRLPKNIILSGGSLAAHVLGQNLFAVFMDEANFRRSADPQEEAYAFYYKLRRRVEGRFLRRTGMGFVGLISSEGGEGVFLDRHCNEIRERAQKGIPNDAYIVQFAEWDIRPIPDLSGEKFLVDIGDNLRSPHILADGEAVRSGAQVIEIPVEYRNDAERELVHFLMDVAGKVPGRANKYFYNVEAALRSLSLRNPVLSEVAELALDTEFEGSDYLDEPALLAKIQGRWRPRILPLAARFIHIDLAKNDDVAGFAMVHVGDFDKGGTPIIHVDFAICFQASAKKPIDYDKILRLIFWLRDSGFSIEKISYDSYQSQHSLNTLEKEGLVAELRSVDRMKDMDRGRKIQPEYYLYRSMLSEDRILNPVSPLLRREILQLISVEEKPDHEKNESKDMVDAIVGACANLIESTNLTAPPSEEELFPMMGTMRGTERNRPKPPISEQQLVEPSYARGDNIFFNP
jgi:hypothetical protein